MDIREFLEQRLSEDEDMALTAAGRHYAARVWTQPDPERQPGLIGDGKGDVVTYGLPPGQGGPGREQAAHMARHDPARVLRDVEVKRRILAAHPLANEPGEPPHCETCRYIADPGDPEPFPEAGYPCPTVRLLALPYDQHPDYQSGWAP